jgi:uncharacterized protein (TIGR02246 family)
MAFTSPRSLISISKKRFRPLKKRFVSAVFLSLVLGPALSFAAVGDDVAAATQAWADAYNSHDPMRVLARYHPEAVFWGTTSATLRDSPEEVLTYFSGLSRRPNAHVTIGESRVRVFGDVALNTGFYTFTDVVDGEATIRPGRFSFAYRLVDGEWLIADHHSSQLPAQ